MRPQNYCGPRFENQILHPITLLAFLIVITIGGFLILYTWFF
ncbi:hypothetical protein [Desulfitobacterium chlororespirans]|nr:hypothetical protein [Desulfitobacterium chlororespirans]